VVPQVTFWAGPQPRVGAALVTQPKTGETWLVGGARGLNGSLPVQDVLAADPDVESWAVLVAAAPPVPEGIAATKPDVAWGSGVWDPVGKRVLVVGGMRVPSGEPSAKLWAWSPGATDFVKVDDQGDKPAAAFRPVFGVGPAGATAWLFGAHAAAPAAPAWTDEPFGATVWSLSLANSTWTRLEPADGPAGAVRAAGGTHALGVDAVVADAAGTLGLWSYAMADGTWAKLGPDHGLAAGTSIDAFVYDPLARVALVLVVETDARWQAKVWAADFAAQTWAARPGTPASGAGAALALHPSLGALGLGGLTQAGAASVLWRVAQECAGSAGAP
jgi:hypothetical protein